MEILLDNLRHREPVVAALLGLVPGAGHLYAGEPLRGLTWLAGTVVGLFLFVVPGVVIWGASIADASLCARRGNLGLRPFAWTPPITWISDGPDPACPEAPEAPAPDRENERRPTAPARGSVR